MKKIDKYIRYTRYTRKYRIQREIRYLFKSLIEAKEKKEGLDTIYHEQIKGYIQALLDVKIISLKTYERYENMNDDIYLSLKERKIK